MARNIFCTIVFTVWLSVNGMAAAPMLPVSHSKPSPTLLMCGGAEVVEARIILEEGVPALEEVWHWRPEQSNGLPTRMMRKFVTTDDCKTVTDGKEVLITSSGDAVALVSHETGATLFYAEVKNAHSAELLPDGLIVVASSSDPAKQGDKLLLFDRKIPQKSICELPLDAAHGVVWDKIRRVLWALGGAEVLKVRVDNTRPKPTMTVEKRIALPAREGHDLQLAADGSSIYVTNTTAVFRLDPDRLTFTPFEPFSGRGNIKSLSIQAETGQIAYTQADPGVWWTYSIHFIAPAYQVTVPSMIYKIRWSTGSSVDLPHAD